jgi:hypothetical protein
MKFTIKEAHIDSDHSLCSRCENGIVYKTDRLGVRRYCSAIKENVKDIVTQCTGFQDKNQLDLWSMQRIAWLVAPEVPRTAGFCPPKDYKKKKPEWHLDEDGELDINDDGD